MKAIILAAGRGSRMGDHTDHLPKALCRFNGRTLLSRQIAALKAAGIDDIAIVGGYKIEKLKGFAPTMFENAAWRQTNMVYTLMVANPWINDTLVVSYADIFYSASTVRALIKDPHGFSLAYDPDWAPLWGQRFADPLSDAECFRMDEDGFLADIGKTPEDIGQVAGQFMGLYKIDQRAWRAIRDAYLALSPQEQRAMDTTAFLRLLLSHGAMIHCVPVVGPWGEADQPEDLKLYERLYPLC